jgi:Sigma-54 interaction domain
MITFLWFPVGVGMNTTFIERRPGRVAPTILADCAADLGIAAQSGLCMLINARPSLALELACEIAYRADRDAGVMAVDCRAPLTEATLHALCSHYREARANGSDARDVLLLQEVHDLSAEGQSILAAALEQWQERYPHRQVIASSSLQVFDRIVGGAFDDRLFYRLNALSVDLRSEASSASQAS